MANLFLLSRKAFVMCSCFRAPIKTFFLTPVKWLRPALVSIPPNAKKPYNKHLISLVFSVRTVNYGSSFFSIDLWPKTRLIRGIDSNLSNTFPAVPRGAWHLSSESDISLIQEIASPHLHCGQILHPISYHPCEWQEIFRCELGWGFLFSCVVAVWMSSAFP